MRVVAYVSFQPENLFFLGTIASATSTEIVIEDTASGRKAVYQGSFSYFGGAPSGTIEGLKLFSFDTLQAKFTEAAWDATDFFTNLMIAVTGGPVQPLIDLVTAADDLAIGSDFPDYFDGGAGDDTVKGNAGDDTLNGGPGHDIALGGTGHDRMSGGGGNDSLNGGEGDDLILGERGDDVLIGGLGHDNLYGGGGRDTFFVDDEDRVISGGAGFDTLSLQHYGAGVTLTGSGGFLPYWEMRVWGTQQQISGIEKVLGSDYSDCLYVNGFAERVKAGAGDDGIQGGAIEEVFFGGTGDDVLAGGAKGDRLFGGQGKDTLFGQDGADSLFGGGGADLLIGGRGTDLLTGGRGADVFAFNKGHGTDNEILDFEDGQDRIRFGEVAYRYEDLNIVDDTDGALISAGNVSVLVRDVSAADLTAEDFLFGRVSDYVSFPECG